MIPEHGQYFTGLLLCPNGSVSSLGLLGSRTEAQSWASPVFFLPYSWLAVPGSAFLCNNMVLFYDQSLSRRRWMKKMRC